QSSTKSEFIHIEKVKVQKNYPISHAQRRLWVLSQFEGVSSAYNLPDSTYLNNNVDVEKFKRAIDAVVDRHEILRTVFKEDGSGEVRQWVLSKEDLGFKIDYKDFRKENNKEEKLNNYVAEDSYEAFDLGNGPLLRASLLHVEDEAYIFYYNMHHIISDGWSMEVLTKDVFSFYEAYKENREPQLRPLRIQYKDYSAWQLQQIEEESFKGHKSFWLDSLKGELPLINLPAAKPRPRIKNNKGFGLSTYLDSEATNKLKKYTQEKGGSLFMTLLAAWNVLIYRYTSQTDIIIGTPVAGREHTDLEDQIGFYVNMLALRNSINPDQDFNSFYKTLKDTTLKSYSHQLYPFDKLVEELNIQRDTSRSAVFDISITYHNISEVQKIATLDAKVIDKITLTGPTKVKFDMELHFREVGNYVSFTLLYNEDIYESEMVQGLMKHYKQLVKELLENPEEKISKIEYLSDKEKHELLFNFNNTNTNYPSTKTIAELFEEQVLKTPEAIALVFQDKEMSYRQLSETSNQLAHVLKESYEIGHEDLVGLQLERSEWLIVSILGILKAGAAYVPIDPEYPVARKEHIINDTSLKLLITETNFVLELDYYQGAVFAIDVEFNPSDYSPEPLEVACTADSLAYIMYTSGSTGKPKGVMIEQKSVVRLVKNTNIYSFS
ncbi:MAG TPA: condensation domain-containing protein, partial [Saprospiraceae bacterium]|nr:condensation domain-containing protein [Saprospiraceae bacterium]